MDFLAVVSVIFVITLGLFLSQDISAQQIHHFPVMKKCAPGFVPLGEICVLNDRCGPGAYPGKVCVMDGKKQPYLLPKHQTKAGIPASQTICAEGLELIFRENTSMYDPACVKPSSVQKLLQRGWTTQVPPIACTLEYDPQCGIDGVTYGNKCMIRVEGIPISHSGECKKITSEEKFSEHSMIEDTETSMTKLDGKSVPIQNCSGSARCFSGIVTQVIDGDTIKVDGKSIRFSLASAPELHEFGGDEARKFIDTICPVGSTALVDEDDGQTEGSYGRIIGVIYCNDLNLNEELLDANLGNLSSEFCSRSEFSLSSWAQKHGCTEISNPKTSSKSTEIRENCDPSYPDFCIPSPPPDLDCKDIPQKRFTVLQPDPHRFDGDKDGIGCES